MPLFRTFFYLQFFFLTIAIIATASENDLAKMPIPIDNVIENKPDQEVLILHRGGVITPEAPECSLRAAKLAGEQGFHMLELDIQESKDHVPMVFHDRTMMEDTGQEGTIAEYTASELKQVFFNNSDQYVPTLKEALEICQQYGMGLMLDIKTDGTDQYYQTMHDLVVEYGLEKSTVAICRYPNAIKHLKDVSLFPMTEEETKRVGRGAQLDLTGKFWFGWPREITNFVVNQVQEQGALVIPSINIFHYSEEQHMELARQDIERMKEAGVIVFQIDSVYADYFK